MSDRERGANRKPDYVIKALDKNTQERAPIGAMWRNEEEDSFYIRLNPFLSIPAGSSYAITAWRTEDKQRKAEPKKRRKSVKVFGPVRRTKRRGS